MPSSKDPIVNRQKAREWRLKNPDKHRTANRLWKQRKDAGLGKEGRAVRDRLAKERDPIGYLLDHARKRAAKLRVPFDLKREDLVMPPFCPVLGADFEWGRGQMGWRNLWAPSLDRIKPQLGYVSGNVTIISNRANHLKSNGTIAEFECVLEYMKRVGANKNRLEQELPLVWESADPQLTLTMG
jgi:hypothetical protein